MRGLLRCTRLESPCSSRQSRCTPRCVAHRMERSGRVCCHSIAAKRRLRRLRLTPRGRWSRRLGRASLGEYWWWVLFLLLAWSVLGLLTNLTDGGGSGIGFLGVIILLSWAGTLLPTLAVTSAGSTTRADLAGITWSPSFHSLAALSCLLSCVPVRRPRPRDTDLRATPAMTRRATREVTAP
jgi:hypothetical protein